VGEKTNISWTDHTFNPWMGCEKVSEGCRNCYAETFVAGRMKLHVWGKHAARHVTKTPWREALRWNREAAESGERRKVFCASLCDIFEDHPTANSTRPKVWNLIRECTALDWQILTKRSHRIADCLPDDWGNGWPHVWLGVSVEDMRVACRVDDLRTIPATVRFISYEPALGSLKELDLAGIDWVIYGGESGPGYRQDLRRWAAEMLENCKYSRTAFFYKQASGPKPGTGVDTLLPGHVFQNFPKPRTVQS
jgi:protein gp37